MPTKQRNYILAIWERQVFMLARTLKNNLKDLNNYKMRTKATKFSNLFSSEPTAVNSVDIRQVLRRDAQQKLMFDEEDEAIFDELYETTEEEIAEYIVEDPDEVQVEFPIQPAVKLETEMPFFKAINYKLGGYKILNNI